MDPNKRFIQARSDSQVGISLIFWQVETAFFWRWWLEQEQETQEMVRDLVTAGQSRGDDTSFVAVSGTGPVPAAKLCLSMLIATNSYTNANFSWTSNYKNPFQPIEIQKNT